MNTYAIAFFISLIAVWGSYGVGHHNGYEEERANVQGAIEEANNAARMTERELDQRIADLSTQLEKVQDDAKKQIAKRDADIASGKLQLYVKTKGTICAPTNAPATSGPDTATAQLDPAFAQSIVAITDDGDTAIRKLNACVAVYNQVREMINGSTTTR